MGESGVDAATSQGAESGASRKIAENGEDDPENTTPRIRRGSIGNVKKKSIKSIEYFFGGDESHRSQEFRTLNLDIYIIFTKNL